MGGNVALRLCVLGSGSSGNAIFVATDATTVLIDAGLSCRQIALRLERIGSRIDQVQAVCLSHEHDDHASGLPVMVRKHAVPMYANSGTVEALRGHPKLGGLTGWTVFETGQAFTIGDLTFEPFSVPHDAYDPVGFVISDGRDRIGVMTDVGIPTKLIRQRLSNCRAVVIEANHDEHLLQEAPRPWSLKQRIRGRQGHLSNDHAAAILADIAGPNLQQVFLAHLSQECNREELALGLASRTLTAGGHTHVKVSLTFPDQVSEVWDAAGCA
jgi:phosphoribosyl 1,2-cyclic phosphodiesterase